MAKRAAIYIRVSTQDQSEKSSPEEQESDCRKLCEKQGYEVVEVYRDIERYRVKGRMVEPSGARSDRPAFMQMIRDIDTDKIDLVVAWKEDRLYRGINLALLDISERVQQKKLEVELAKEIYDPLMAGGKAWAASIELQAKKERAIMGVKARAKAGKAWPGSLPYGYKYNPETEQYEINEDEAKWVTCVWEWRAEGISYSQIRLRLIEGGAPQRRNRKKPGWFKQSVRKIIEKKYYVTGLMPFNIDGETYYLNVPKLVDEQTAAEVKRRSAEYKAYPAGHIKTRALLAGKLYCQACGLRMRLYTSGPYHRYLCQAQNVKGYPAEGCCSSMNVNKADNKLMEILHPVFTNPRRLDRMIRKKISEIKSEEKDYKKEIERVDRELESLELEREKVVTWARKGIITEDDLDYQLTMITESQDSLKRELAEMRLISTATTKLESITGLIQDEFNNQVELLYKETETEQEKDAQFLERQKFIDYLIDHAELDSEKNLRIELSIKPKYFKSVDEMIKHLKYQGTSSTLEAP